MPTSSAALPRQTRSAWQIAWLIAAPLALWLLMSKAIALGSGVIRHSINIGTPGDTWLAAARWLVHFACVRVLVMALVAWAVQRLFFPRRRLAGVWIFALLVLGTAVAMTVVGRAEGVVSFLSAGGAELWSQLLPYLKCAWPEATTICCIVLALGAAIQLLPPAARPAVVCAAQALAVLLCLLLGMATVSELAIGQPLNAYVLLFGGSHLGDVMPLIHAETTPFRLLVIGLSIAAPIAWAWRHRALAGEAARLGPPGRHSPRRGLLVAAAGACAAFAPNFAVGMLPMERFSNGTLVAFARTVATTESREATDKVNSEFAATGRPRWHSAQMAFVPVDGRPRRNVVIVMMESMRAVSTTMHAPALKTTPYLAQLAARSLSIEDMSAVVPRTAGAWLAVLGGQYPLTNEGAARWAIENVRQPRARGMPHALRAQGYATSFFTAATLRMLSDQEVVKALGFDTIVGEDDLADLAPGGVNYMGHSDEVMIRPILEWSAAQVRAGRPFMTTVMTNVGHHPYTTPASWKKVAFEGVADPALNDYLNCLLYIDGVVAELMAGYERMGVLNDTIFVFMGDHGQFFGEHGVRQAFNALYEEGLRIPAFIYAPGLLQPGTVRGPRQQIDFLPTLAELLGYRVEGAQLPGVSLLSPVPADRSMFFSSSMESTILAARHGPRKYIYSFGRVPTEVYDLDKDPAERHPVAGVAADEVSRVIASMLEWRAATELSLFARPSDPARPDAPWQRQ